MTSRRPRVVAALVAVGVALVTALAGLPAIATPAAAAVPVPDVRAFGPAIDSYASSQRETGCDPIAKPGPEAVVRLIEATYGDQSTNISRGCSASESGHEEGRSIDWMLNASNETQKARADAFLAWLLATDDHGNAHAMARRLGIMYVIWNKRMWRAYNPSAGWQPYSGWSPHTDHIHLSFSWEGAAGYTSYYSGKALPGLCPSSSTGSAPAVSTARHGFVPLPQRRIVNSGSGYGIAAPCRLHEGGRFDVQVTGRGGVPASGVKAVALQVTLSRASRGATVTAWPAGASKPTSAAVAAPWRTSRAATTVVPIGADGKVSLSVSDGTSEVAVDVVGYVPATGGSAYEQARQERVLDVTLPADGRRTVTLGGEAGMPATGFRGAVVGVTAVAPEAGGGLAAWSAGASTPPSVPAVRLTAGRTTTNRVVVPTTDAGAFVLHNRTSKPLRVWVDVDGRFTATGSPNLTPASGGEIVDTREGQGVTGAFTAGRTATFAVVGRGAPTGSTAALLQVTSFTPSADTRLTAWASGEPRPYTAAFHPRDGETESRLVLAPIGADGKVALYNRSGTTHVAVNLLGYVR